MVVSLGGEAQNIGDGDSDVGDEGLNDETPGTCVVMSCGASY